MAKNPQNPSPPEGGALSRREAISGIGSVGAALALGQTSAGCRKGWRSPADEPTSIARNKPWVPGAEKYGTFEERWVSTSCGQCPAACGINVRLVEGRAVRIEGNPANPVNRGGIGPRGLAALQALYDADRIQTPLIRINGVLEPTTWEEGMALLTKQLARLRTNQTPHRLLVLSGQERGFMHELFGRFSRAFGTPNFGEGRPSETACLAQAAGACFGSDEPPAFMWAEARNVLTLEASLFEDSCQSVYLARIASEGRRGRSAQRGKRIHAGPSFDLSAHNADEWIRIEPGTSGALALGICNVLLGAHVNQAMAVWGGKTGIADFADFVTRFSPERVYSITGVEPETVVRLAEELWDSRPSMAVIDHRSVAFSNGLETATAALALNAILSAENPAGLNMRVVPEAPLAAWPEFEPDAIAQAGLATPRLDRAGTAEFPRARSIHETLPEAIAAAGEDRPEVALLYYANPAYARQQPERWAKTLADIPFVVSFSPYLDDTVAAVADLVLPDHTSFERWEDATPAPRADSVVVGVRRPVIEPLHDTRATGDVLIRVAQGVDESLAKAFPWPSFQKAIEPRLLGLRDADRGSIRAMDDRAFLDKLYQDAFWADSFEVPSTKHFSFVAGWSEPEWHGDPQEYPLKLLALRPLGYAVGSGANQPWLRNLRSRPDLPTWTFPVSVHPATAGPHIKNGHQITVTSPWGTVSAPAHLDDQMRQGYVAIFMGGGHTAFGRWADGFGVNVMRLLEPGPMPVSGANVYCSTRVKIHAG